MGIEFIRSASGKPYQKRWARGLDRTKQPSLLDVRLGEEARVVTATLVTNCAPKLGASVIVQTNVAGEVVVHEGLRQIGQIARPPAGVAEAMAAQHGMAQGVVERLGAFGTAEIKLK